MQFFLEEWAVGVFLFLVEGELFYNYEENIRNKTITQFEYDLKKKEKEKIVMKNLNCYLRSLLFIESSDC